MNTCPGHQRPEGFYGGFAVRDGRAICSTCNLPLPKAKAKLCPDCGRTCVPPVSKRPFCPACGTAPFQDKPKPGPDWRCKACEQVGHRHCSDPANCGGMAPPEKKS